MRRKFKDMSAPLSVSFKCQEFFCLLSKPSFPPPHRHSRSPFADHCERLRVQLDRETGGTEGRRVGRGRRPRQLQIDLNVPFVYIIFGGGGVVVGRGLKSSAFAALAACSLADGAGTVKSSPPPPSAATLSCGITHFL